MQRCKDYQRRGHLPAGPYVLAGSPGQALKSVRPEKYRACSRPSPLPTHLVGRLLLPKLPTKHAPTCWHLQRRTLTPPGTANSWRRACLSRSPRTAKACLPSMPPPDFTLPRILPRPQATWQRQGVNFELLKQSVMHDFGVVLLFGSFFYLLPLCCWFELPPTAGQQCCFWSG